jgi:E3 ubiquitin-protein ligase EDD1
MLFISSSGNGSSGNGNNNGSAGNGGGGSSSSSKNAQASSRQLARSTRARIMRTNNGSSVRGQTSRSTGVIIGGSTSGRSLVHTVPATFVPEELISQAQVVLQGKSRNLIIRELQRTNLDVNLAVNNLLSRDDEEGEDTEEGNDNYVPEDLISLLDSGIHPDPSLLLDNDAMFSEDMRTFRNLMLSSRDRMQSSSSSQAANQNDSNNLRAGGSSAVVTGNSGAPGASTSLSFGRIRDRTYFGPRRWFQSSREEVQWEKEQDSRNKMDTTSGFPLWISDDLEYWPDKDGTRFTQIASLHSEFIAVSTKGELHQWRWMDREPYRNNENPNMRHPKVTSLALVYEKIVHISATTIRCSIVTESGKIATFMDELLGFAGNKLEHQATSYPEFTLDKIISLHTCSLYTIARTESGELFWWGVLPFSQRKKMWERYKAKSKKPQKKDKEKDVSLTNEIIVGAQVCMKNIPMYQPGAIGFCISNGVPKVGQLTNAAWDLMTICRFKILPMPQHCTSTMSTSSMNIVDKEPLAKISNVNSNSNSSGSTSSVGNKETADRMDMPPPPSPASSTCSDTSVSVKRKRMMQKEEDKMKDEELWNLKDVVFVEDTRSVQTGRVLKVDGQYVAVRFQNSNASSKDKFDESSADAWQECRLLRKDELQLIKSTANSRVPDCIQKIPRRVVLNQQLNENSQLLTLTVDSKGIHTIMRTGQKLHYSLFNLSSGKLEKTSNFPTDLNSFMGKAQNNISLQCAGDQQESILILRDGNKTIYPLAKDCVEAIRDPLWMDLPPLSCIALTPVTVQSTSSNTKTQITLVILATEQQALMPKIMRCDVDAVKYFLQQLNGELKSQVTSVVQEFTDGNRNILHACVSQCSPSSNKDSDQDLLATASATAANNSTASGLECINTIPNSMITSRSSSNIRDLMRRSSSTSALAGEVHHLPAASAVSVTSADDNSINLSYWPSEYDGNSGDEDSLSGIHMPKQQQQQNAQPAHPNEVYISDPTERRLNALLSVQLICENQAMQSHLRQLLSAKDSTGQTPFMLAVSSRAYQAGIILFDTILKIANGDVQIRDSMVFPNGSTPDQSPLHVLCCNDTCSFTWTGADHINQDIFECQTCGKYKLAIVINFSLKLYFYFRFEWIALLLHRMRKSLSQRTRLQIEADNSDGILRLLAKM